MPMDCFVNRGDRSRSVSGDSAASGFMASTPSASSSRDCSPSQMSVSDIEASQRSTQVLEDSLQEDSGAGDATAADKKLKRIMSGLEKFFVFDRHIRTETSSEGRKERTIYTGQAKCQQKACKGKTITFSSKSKANLRKHYEKMHKDLVTPLAGTLEGLSKRGRCASRDDFPSKRSVRQLCMEETFAKQEEVTPEQKREAWNRWFIETMTPLSITDHPSLRGAMGLIAPDFSVPSRRTMARNLENMAEKAKLDLSNLLFGVQYVATTADSWTVHSHTFVGMTVHWIDPVKLDRRHGTLMCKEVKESQDKSVIAKVISDVHDDFGLSHKLTATTTDNGTNYCAAFSHFGVEDVPVEGWEKPDPEVVDGQPCDLHNHLQEVADYRLPTHYRCGAHTVNLIATKDVKEVKGWNYGPRAAFTKAASKAQATWNLQNRNPVWANQIKAKTGHKLKTFCVTRWNSYYEAVKSLLKAMATQDKMDELNRILAQQKGCDQFEIVDRQVLSEYAKVMEPVAKCLNKFQGEENAYMGTLLPSLQLMRIALEELQADRTLQYAQPLVTALLGSKESGKGFYGRFSHVFEDDKIIMSSALHPHYTLALVRHFLPDKAAYIKDRIVREMKAIVGIGEEVQAPQQQANKEQDEFASILAAAPQIRREEEVEEVIKKELEGWQREMTSIPISPDKFPSIYRDAWLDLFRRYNTPLPSSAAVERLFSSAGDILKPRRSSLSNLNFESLVFLRGNFNLLGFKEWPKVSLAQGGQVSMKPQHLAQLQQCYQSLGALEDDAYVIEAPSFIMPYVMEGKPKETIKDFLKRVNKDHEEFEKKRGQELLEKQKEEQAAEEETKKAEEKAGEEKEGESDVKEKDGVERKEAGKEDKENEKVEDAKEKLLKDKEEDKDKETEKTKKVDADSEKDVNNSKKDGKDSSKDEDDNKENRENKDKGAEVGDTKKEEEKKDDLSHLGRWEPYYRSALGKFFLELGLNQAEEFLQSDLLRMSKHKIEKMKSLPSKEDMMAVKILEKQLEKTRAKNAHLTVPLKTCKFCSFKSESDLVMEQHLESPHMVNYTYKCNFCDFETRGPQVILFHMEAEHNVRGRLERAPAFFQCALCSYEDNNKCKMTRHSLFCAKKFKPERNCEITDWEPPAKIPKILRGRPNTLGKAFEPVRMPNLLPRGMGLSQNIQQGMASQLAAQGRGRGRPVGSYKTTQPVVQQPGQSSIMYQTRTQSNVIRQVSGTTAGTQQFTLSNQLFHTGTQKKTATQISSPKKKDYHYQSTNRGPHPLPSTSTSVSLISGLAASSSITIQVPACGGPARWTVELPIFKTCQPLQFH